MKKRAKKGSKIAKLQQKNLERGYLFLSHLAQKIKALFAETFSGCLPVHEKGTTKPMALFRASAMEDSRPTVD